MNKHKIEMPELYLIIIATYGKLGTGDTPRLMQLWAKQECKRLGLTDKLREMQRRNIIELRQQIKNTLGKETLDSLDKTMNDMINKLKKKE